jgi:hypothetical protein
MKKPESSVAVKADSLKGHVYHPFKKYMHLEKFGNTPVEGIELGKTYIFPKIDGTNGSVWLGGEQYNGQIQTFLRFGSRNREITNLENDNQGFMESFCGDANDEVYSRYHSFLEQYPSFFQGL